MSEDIQKPVERTEAQREAARLNGAKSKGPRTPEGKAISSQNSRKHGFSARKFLLEDEEPEEFAELLEEYRASHRPANRAEDDLVREIAVYRFRLEKVWEHRAAAFDIQRLAEHKALHPGIRNPDDELLSAKTFLTQSKNGELEAIDRHESHFSRLYNRALRNLLQLQRHRMKYHPEPEVAQPALQNEPEPERLYSINEVINAGHIPSLRPIPVRNVDVVTLLSADDPDLDVNEPDPDDPALEKAS